MLRLVRKAGLSGALWRIARGGVPTLAAALMLDAGLTGCGSASGTSGGSRSATSSASSSAIVLRVGEAAINRAEVEHWASAIHRGNAVATALGPIAGTPRQKALQFLISANWLIGELEAQGLSISSAAVERGLRAKIEGGPNGRSEFDEELSSTGQTLADVKLEVKSSLAVAKLRDAVAKRVPAVTGAEVRSYYAHHRQRFYLPDRRVAYLIEGIHSYAHALALARQVRPGARLAMPWFRELVFKTPEAAEPGKLAHMVFAATPGRVYGPTMFFGHWVLAVVRRLIPAGIQSLAAVSGELSKTLAVERRERTLTRFTAAFVRKWTARTVCSPGYVVRKCSEQRGAPTVKGNPLTGG